MYLLRRIEAYLRVSGTTATRFGRDALGDPCFVPDLRNGREPRAATLRRVRTHLDAMERKLAEDKSERSLPRTGEDSCRRPPPLRSP